MTIEENIKRSGISIYDAVNANNNELWLPNDYLEAILDKKLKGFSLENLPLRTRSRVIKEKLCNILGYPIPKSFQRTQPRFLGQNFDIYVQKSNNLQIWNEEISPDRRYVLIKLSEFDIVEKVRVLSGSEIARLDHTGTLTQKYQAKLDIGQKNSELISDSDTQNMQKFIANSSFSINSINNPCDKPVNKGILPISIVFEKLSELLDAEFMDIGSTQERNRGAILHELICKKLGFGIYKDDGKFPDIFNQLLEIKLQTSPTIDLGLVCPNSDNILCNIDDQPVRHCDIRYAIFYGKLENSKIKITNFYLTTGEDFFKRFSQFQGKITNKKLQIPLPESLFKSK